MELVGLESSTSRRRNCYENATVESIYQLLKRERIKLKPCTRMEEARMDIFEYIEMFYTIKRLHGSITRCRQYQIKLKNFY
ncbi:hypothetical protein BSZ05_22840 [Vibrio mediterranei]|uniref:Integrase catalytic domain-containing protein n=1 Tax=Vibrio mediterranei TaxID=689 RepID=A0AAN1FL07_9VIBR|nr:hypothetical protein BSZ05_22840 [Vibrio mediterranei]